MIKLFNPYHTFPNANRFLATFTALGARGRITPISANIPRFCGSVEMKLQNSIRHLKRLESVDEWDLPPSYSPSSPTTVSSGVSIVTSSYTPTPIYSTKTSDVSGTLDDFFANIFSAFDVFAQIFNIVYLTAPRPEDWVSFDRIINLLPVPPHNRDLIKPLLDGCQKAPLNKLANLYRNCSTHRKAIPFKVCAEIEPFTIKPSIEVIAILLPDDPEADPPAYLKQIEARKFSLRVLKHSLSVIDRAYGIMEQTIRLSDSIPV